MASPPQVSYNSAMTRCAAVTATGVALALCAGLGCGSGDGSAASKGPAGTITALAGEVTARRGDAAARVLAVRDDVFRDDTISTGDGSSVTIVLAHNNAVWTLGADQQKRVDASAAWRAPKSSDEIEVAEGTARTAAAGRHAEKSATDRPAFATETKAEEAPTAAAPPPEPEPEPAPAPAEAMPPPPPPPPSPRPKRKHSRTSSSKPKPPKGGGSDLDDLLSGGDGPPKSSGGGGGGSNLPEKLSRSQIQAGVARIRGSIAKCATDGGPKIVKVRVAVAPSGSVSSATAVGEGADTDAARCVVAAVRRAKFDKASKPTSFTYPFRL